MVESDIPVEQFLMVDPLNFDIRYVINPWMQDHVGRVDKPLARSQWQQLHDTLSEFATVTVLDSEQNMPDMVFSANAAVVSGDTSVIANFLHMERRHEEPAFESWFRQHNYQVVRLDPAVIFEGAGDALFQPGHSRLWLGYGVRSNYAAVEALGELFPIEVVPLRLVDSFFYHLDTCFCPLIGGRLLYYPDAFDKASLDIIHSYFEVEDRIAVSSSDARLFACNCVNVRSDRAGHSGGVIIMSTCSDMLQQCLNDHDYLVKLVSTGEFVKAGGSVKCLTLSLSH